MDAKDLTHEITNFLNSYGDKSEAFNEAMSREHRTLQQNFTRLCLKWLEHVASDEYSTDARNEQSKDISQKLLAGFKYLQIKEGFTGGTLEMMSKPSRHLGMI